MRKLLTALFTFGVIFISAGQSLNQYKYILIPETYEFTGEVDQYRLNSMTKFLFEKEGFNTLMKTENRPAGLKQNPCLGITTKLENNSGIFVTKLVLKLEDCYGNVVFSSKEGRSREKEFAVAYKEALRDAFESVKELDYHYAEGSENIEFAGPEKESPEKPQIQVTKALKEDTIEEEEAPTPVKIAKEPKAIVDAEEADNPSEGENGMAAKRLFEYNGQRYTLKPADQGFGLYIENSPEPIALLLKSERGDNFIYNSLSNQGLAYFDKQGNLVVEYVNRQNNEKNTIVYLKKY
ncbi:MAG: hypothetical protein R3214_12175 [Christiangramia sp.]|nr:hypothetical protein [Christiangramia sp.]